MTLKLYWPLTSDPEGFTNARTVSQGPRIAFAACRPFQFYVQNCPVVVRCLPSDASFCKLFFFVLFLTVISIGLIKCLSEQISSLKACFWTINSFNFLYMKFVGLHTYAKFPCLAYFAGFAIYHLRVMTVNGFRQLSSTFASQFVSTYLWLILYILGCCSLVGRFVGLLFTHSLFRCFVNYIVLLVQVAQ